MKCYLEKCINNDEWACMYRADCRECNRGCKNYYKCSSCDYYMDEELEEEFQQGGEIEDAFWFYADDVFEVILPEPPPLDPRLVEAIEETLKYFMPQLEKEKFVSKLVEIKDER